jgi:hypothetical protein
VDALQAARQVQAEPSELLHPAFGPDTLGNDVPRVSLHVTRVLEQNEAPLTPGVPVGPCGQGMQLCNYATITDSTIVCDDTDS